jgi:hypothetical protein
MKKLFAILSLAAFFAVSVNAQTSAPSATPAVSKESVDAKAETVTPEAKTESKPACCVKKNASCCKNNKSASHACTAEQKAACAKSGKECKHDHAKAETKENTSGTK